MIRKGLLFAFIILLLIAPAVSIAQTRGDRDGDGVPDNEDKCPDVAGPASNGGCPLPPSDRDGDGLPDDSDKCPDQPGPRENGGCPLPPPDSDNDGLPDDQDQCPTVPGPRENNGCPLPTPIPDSDGDGLPDNVDQCPQQFGPRENNGCPLQPTPTPTLTPIPDSDGDGLPDNADRCPNQPGPRENNGCPVTPTPQRPPLASDGPCVVASLGASNVNMYGYPALTDGNNVVGQLLSADTSQIAYVRFVMNEVVVSSVLETNSPTNQSHESEIEVLSWSFGASQTNQSPYLELHLENTLISSYSISNGDQAGGDEIPIESWSWGITHQPGLSETWYLLGSPNARVWVRGSETVQGGDCSQMPTIELTPSSTTVMVDGRLFGLRLMNSGPGFTTGADGALILELECDTALERLFGCNSGMYAFDRRTEVVTVPFLEGHAKLIRAPASGGDTLIAFVGGNVDLMLIIGNLPSSNATPAEAITFDSANILYGYTPSETTEQLSLNFALMNSDGGIGCSVAAPASAMSSGLFLTCSSELSSSEGS